MIKENRLKWGIKIIKEEGKVGKRWEIGGSASEGNEKCGVRYEKRKE